MGVVKTVGVSGTFSKERTVTVALSGGDFTSVQAAINSITVGAGERWTVLIHAGEYNENVTLKNGVSLVGVSRDDVIIYSNTGDVITFGTGASTISHLTVRATPVAPGSRLLYCNAAGAHHVYNTHLVHNPTGTYATSVEFNVGAMDFQGCHIDYTQTGVGGGDHIALKSGANGAIVGENDDVDMLVAADDDIYGFQIATTLTPVGFIRSVRLFIDAQHATYSSNAYAVFISGSPHIHYLASEIELDASGAGPITGIGTIIHVNNGAAEVQGVANSVHAHDFATNYHANIVNAGDLFNSTFDAVEAVDGNTGAGTINFVDSPSPGNLQLSGGIFNLYDFAVTVAARGGDHTTIQAAINAITVGAGERYVVLIYPGEYTENITLKDGVDLRGVGTPSDVTIKATSGDLLTLGGAGASSTIQDVRLLLETTGTTTPRLIVSTGGSATFLNCVMTIDVTNGYLSAIDLSGGFYVFSGGNINYVQTGTSIGLNSIFAVSGTAIVRMLGPAITMSIAAIAAATEARVITSSTVIPEGVGISDMDCSITCGTAAFDGHVDFFRHTGASIGHYVKASRVVITTPSGAASSIGSVYHVDNGAAELRSSVNQLSVVGFTLNYAGEIVQAGDTLDSHFDDTKAVDEVTGAGTNNAVDSLSDGDIRITGTAYGGTGVGDELVLRGSTAADLGQIRVQAPLVFDDIQPAYPGEAYSLIYTPTQTFTAGYIGGGVNISPVVTFTASLFIWEALRGSPQINSGIAPGFAAFTLFQALPVMRAGVGFDALQALVLNCGVAGENTTVQTRTWLQVMAVNMSCQVRTTVSGAVLNLINYVGMNLKPVFSTVAGSTISLGSIRGVWCLNPTNALFQPSAGLESMVAYYGLDFENITFGGNVNKAALYCKQVAASNAYCIRHTGTAQSVLGGPLTLPNDFPNGAFGMGASGDFSMGWVSSGAFYMQINNPAVTQWRYTAPSTNRLQMECSTAATGEFTFNCAKFSLGAQTGAVGNQVGLFTTGTRTVALAGEWSDFLLTQGGTLTLNAAMTGVFAWTVIAPSILLGTGSVTTAGVLNVGGNVLQGSVNRFGVRILSNPVGGSGVNAALWVTLGRTRLDGILDINKPIALGGGAAATLGTIGATGPTAAAQAQWVQIEVNGVNHWIAAWT